MKASEVYQAINTGNHQQQQSAMFELLFMVQKLSIAVLELAGNVKQYSGRDPLMLNSRTVLKEFAEIKGEQS